ncbi:uncharacterized protein F5147DRAFT_778352 [Suillus discolor]|uniref:Uncharacterized protein n=1 Tax=Suillus discolor TaxID=1912936 RepID=A0A9P7JPP4_9AGAM|nr:uncharacterized protein F5147DRAFT_778352 [Suillus discolor]KAG2096303.1 hypothetical protein F5147DRAFT_778352 [Suillus discolor]
MTHTFGEYPYPLEPGAPPPQSYSTSSQSMHLLPGRDYVQEQYGGGCRPKTPPVELTPTRLRSRIKATQHDVGIVKEAAIRRQENSFPPDALTIPAAPAPAHPTYDNSVMGGDVSSTQALPQGNRHTSPRLHDPDPPDPAPLQDMFYDPMEAQPSGWLPQHSNSFGEMDDASFTALLMETQGHFMSSDASPSFTNQPSSSHAPSHEPPVPQSAEGSSRQIAPMTTNVIPPTPLKDVASSYSLSDPPRYPSPHERGASVDARNVNDLFSDPQGSKDAPSSMSDQSFVPGRKSANTNAILEAAFVEIEQSFLELSGSTSIPVQQVINWFLKSRGQTTVSTNFWNIYARSYFKDHTEQELAWVGHKVPADGGSPGMSIQTKCYDLFKEAFPDTYKDILSVHDEVKMLSASPQTVSQRAQEFQKYYRRMFSIADSAAAKFGFETAMVICGKIVNQDASLGQVHTTPGAAEFWSTRCRADDDTIIGHLKAHVYNKTSMAVVENAFDDLPEDDKEASSRDADSIPSTEVEGRDESLRWLKKEIAKQVTKLGGKFASDKNFPWKTMPSTLASGGLNIEGYPAHMCLMPGESHDPTSKNNKGIGVLTFKEVAALVDAYKAGTMWVVKSSNTHTSLIESTEPVIIREAPPSTWEHASARCMFADRHTDYGGPECVGTSVAQTRVKKGKNVSRARDPEHGEAVMSRPPARPFKVVAKPISKPQTPPPARPFRVVTRPAAPMAPKAAAQEVIELTSTSEGSRDVTAEVDIEYEDDSRGKKRKLKSGSSSQMSKKRVSAEVVIELTKEGVHSKAKPSPSDASVLKGGPLSPLTVGSSSVDEHLSGDEAAQPVQPAARIRDGPSNVQPKSKALPKPKRITKASWAAMRRAHKMMYAVDSEEEDAPGQKDSKATADAGKGAVVLADPQPDAAAQPANPTPIEPPATMVTTLSPLEVTPSVAAQHEGSEQPQPSNGTLQTMSSPSTPGNDENGTPKAQSIERPSSHPAGERPLPQPEPLHTDPHIEAANRYAHSPLLQCDAPITHKAPLHMHELPRHPREPSVLLREPLLHPRAPSVPLREPLLHPHAPSAPFTTHTHPHPTSGLNPHGLPRTHNLEEARYAHVPMGYNHPSYPSHYNSPAEGYDDRYDDRRHPSDLYYQDMCGHDGRYYGDTNRWADRR